MGYHSDVEYITEVSKNHVPLPSHFNPSGLKTGAIDNFDNEETTLSGIGEKP